ncbi:hypothetical protein GCM10023213_24160 [Prosthecobacter algae]|uniref:Uncharacterized protein n=2 Tax=Prosthecobacter algae TaxID=1144682 RepID=A0ABP9P4Z2_9BACT
MGYSDKLEVTISCDDCGVTEENSAKDYGGGYGGPAWEHLDSFSDFTVVATHDERRGPDIKSATCKKCCKPAKIQKKYSQ